jgi:GNAT superfamily N-acetyltransferase
MNNNSNIHIRRAERKDAAAMMALIRELALFEKAPDEVTVTENHFIESGFGPNPIWWAFVAENEVSGIVAFALYYIRYSTWKGQRLYLEDIIVNEKWRGKGIGSQLMEVLIQETKEKAFSGMMWQVLDWNEPAIQFYKKYNSQFQNDWINVNLDL